jgi:hypothetical protein
VGDDAGEIIARRAKHSPDPGSADKWLRAKRSSAGRKTNPIVRTCSHADGYGGAGEPEKNESVADDR